MFAVVILYFLICMTGSVFGGDFDMKGQKQVTILLGPPGSGKGTQAVKISRYLGVPHISTGDLFREHLKNGTDLGATAKKYLDSGQLVPDFIVLDMLFDRISKEDCRNGYLLDGFPRTVAQAKALEHRLQKDSSKLAVVNMCVPESEVIRRLEGRLTCKNCGNVQHKEFSPPKNSGVCDKCNGELYQRSDDHLEVIQQRLGEYRRQTAPLIEYYEKRKALSHVDGNQMPETVFNDMVAVLES